MTAIRRKRGEFLSFLEGGPAQAEPVVLIHGILDSASCWFPVMDALLDRGYRVLAVDLLGHGDSPRIIDSFTVPELASGVVETLDEQGIDSCLLVGHSLGGVVAQQIAETRPNLARKLVVEDPAWGVADDDPGATPGVVRSGIERTASWPIGRMLRHCRAVHPQWDERDIAGWLEAIVDVDPRIIDVPQNWVGDTGAAAWAHYRGPVLLVTGGADYGAVVTEDMVGLSRMHLGHALTHVAIPSAGHNIHKDEQELYCEALLNFLAD